MIRQSTISRCGSQDRLTVPQMRGMLEMIARCVEDDSALCEFAFHLQKAIITLDTTRDVALAVMREVDSEHAIMSGSGAGIGPKLC
jgi:hypothetical protein